MASLSWAEETLRRLQEERVGAEISLAENVLLKAQEKYVWEEFRDAAKQNCEELNEKAVRMVLHFDVTVQVKVRVRRFDLSGKPNATLSVEFDADSDRIRYECGAGKGEFILESNIKDSSVLIRDAYHRYFTPKEAAGKVLDLLMRSQF